MRNLKIVEIKINQKRNLEIRPRVMEVFVSDWMEIWWKDYAVGLMEKILVEIEFENLNLKSDFVSEKWVEKKL